MGFELAIPLFMLGMDIICFIGFMICHRDRPTLFHITLHDALVLGTTLFSLLGFIFLKHIVEFENIIGNPVLTRMENLLEIVYIAGLWLFVAIIAVNIIAFTIRAIVLFKQVAIEKKIMKEKAFETEW